MSNFDIQYTEFIIFKKAFKECKKLKSTLIKDSFDTQLLDPLIKLYKTTLGKKTEIEIGQFNQFFTSSINYSEKWLSSKNKSKFYLTDRINATNNLINASNKIIKSLEKQTKISIPPTLDKIGGKLVKSGYKLNCTPFVIDIPYVGTSFTTIRCYITIHATGTILGKIINSPFDFANYELNDQPYHDASISNRSIYKVTNVNIKLPIIGSVNIEVYVSPNDFLSKGALKIITMPMELLTPSDLS